MIQKIKTILLSRVKTTEEKDWILKRRETCLSCKHNTLNGSALSWYKFFLATLSSLYSYLMNKSNLDVLGNCTACQACSIYFKTAEEEEICPKNMWEVPLVETTEEGTTLRVRESRISTTTRQNYLNK
jgi:hypothetical protein